MHRLIIAAAGSGKTTFLCRFAILQDDKKTLIVTYTDENEECIKDKLIELHGFIPQNVEVMSWFSFLLKHGVKPYQGRLYEPEVRGMILVNEKSGMRFVMRNGVPCYFSESDVQNHYFNRRNRIYSDKVSKFAVKCIDLTEGKLLTRLAGIYNQILVDEAQDLAGYDLELIKRIMASGIPVIMVSDPRQATYNTHYDDLYKKYRNGNLPSFCTDECESVTIDYETLATSYRNNIECVELSSALFPDFPKPIVGNHTRDSLVGVFLICEDSAWMFLDRYCGTQLRPRKDSAGVFQGMKVMNIGRSKGREFDSVLIFPTKNMLAWLLDHRKPLKDKTRAQLYVALTRAQNRVGIFIGKDEFTRLEGSEVVEGLSIYRL
jgi:DNA helicase-2/ATP-dependent DNA helicase PcrA